MYQFYIINEYIRNCKVKSKKGTPDSPPKTINSIFVIKNALLFEKGVV